MTRAQLQVPSPCPESWAAMTPAGPGRHCAACAKVVVDFTQKTDAEILAYLAGAAGKPCGRFRATQLGRPLQPPPAASRWRAWLGALLAVGSLGSGLAPQANAQYHYAGSAGPLPTTPPPGQKPAPPAHPEPGAPAAPTAVPSAALPGSPPAVRGVVRDAATHDPLPGVTVLIKGTPKGTATNEQGEFELAPTASGQVITLVFSFVGYTRTEQAAVPGVPLAVELSADVQGMGEVIVVGGMGGYTSPAPWHPRAFYHWGKYWLTRPFRH